MSFHLSSQAIGSILSNYADVIDGGTAWRGSGTAFPGIPGTKSNDPTVREYTTLTATAAGTSSAIVVANTPGSTSTWARTETPSLYLRCDSGAAAAVDCARRITSWSLSSTTFTTDAFPVAPGSGAVFTVLQGFHRLPNGIDIESAEQEYQHGFDRFYDLALTPLRARDVYGSGAETWDGRLDVRLRLVKFGKLHSIRESMAENLTILASALVRGEHRDSNYVRAILPPTDGPDILVDDEYRLVCRLTFPVIFRILRTFG